MKKSLLIHYFLVNLIFLFIYLFMGFLCVLKMYHVRLFIVEKMGFGTAPRQCGIRSKPQSLLQKTCLSYASKILAAYTRMCLHTHALACIRRPRPTYAGRKPHAQATTHIHRTRPTYVGRGPLWSFYFQK